MASLMSVTSGSPCLCSRTEQEVEERVLSDGLPSFQGRWWERLVDVNPGEGALQLLVADEFPCSHLFSVFQWVNFFLD